MKKFNSFEERLGAYIVEYAMYVNNETSPQDAYMMPDRYPFFKRMCDVIIRDVLCGYDAYNDTDEDHVYIYANAERVLEYALDDMSDGLLMGTPTDVYNVCTEYAELAMMYVRTSFKAYLS